MLLGLCLLPLAMAQQVSEVGDWKVQPFLRPQGGLSSWSSGSSTQTALYVGAQGGVRFWQKKRDIPYIQGLLRARGTYLVSSATGLDARVGLLAGPAWEQVRIQTGPDLFWNQFDWGSVALPPTLGLAWPAQVLTNLGGVSLSAGLQPAFFLASERDSVDWSEQSLPGFGDEMTYFAGAGAALGSLRVSLSLTQTITAYGVNRGVGFGVRI